MFYKSFLGLFAKLRKATVSFVTSIRPSAKKKSAPTTRIFKKFDISVFLENLLRNFKVRYNLTRITGTLHDDQYTVMISHSVLLRMTNFLDKICRVNQSTHFTSNNFLFLKIVPFMR